LVRLVIKMISSARLFLVGIFLIVFLFIFRGISFAQTSGGSSIFLSPEFQELKVNEEFTVEVLISSNQKLIGADVLLSFNPDVLEVVSIDDGNTFSKIPLKAVSEGKIKITAVEEDRGKTFSGEGSLAKIKFKTKDAGETNLELELTQGATTDSNLTTPEVKDVLSEIKNSNFVVGSPLQRGTASVRRAIVKASPFLIFLIFVGVIGFFGYKWWKKQQETPKNVFVQRKVPMDKPPSDE